MAQAETTESCPGFQETFEEVHLNDDDDDEFESSATVKSEQNEKTAEQTETQVFINEEVLQEGMLSDGSECSTVQELLDITGDGKMVRQS